MNNSGSLPAIKLLDTVGLSKLAKRSLEENSVVTSILLLAHNGSVFAEAHRAANKIHSSGSPPTSTSSSPLDSTITTTRSLRTQAITYSTAYTSYLRDIRPDQSTTSLSPSTSSTRVDSEGEPITFESRKSPSVTIISPVGEKILLAVTGDFAKSSHDSDETDTPPHNDDDDEERERDHEHDDTDMTSREASQSAGRLRPEEDVLGFHRGSSILDDPGTNGTGRLTPPHDLVETLQEISAGLVERLRTEFEGMKWPIDL